MGSALKKVGASVKPLPSALATEQLRGRGQVAGGAVAMPGAPDVAGFTASALALLELTGRALLLRPLESGDFEQWRDAQSRNRSRLDAVNPAGWNDTASAVDSQEAFDEVVGYLDALRDRDEGYAFAMFAGDELVGEIDLGAIVREPLQTAMLGLWLDENQVGKGYAEEAFFQMCRFGFEELGLHRLEALALPENEAVKGALRKAGIRSEGMAQRAREVNGEWRDHERYAITAEEWEDRRDEALRQWVE